VVRVNKTVGEGLPAGHLTPASTQQGLVPPLPVRFPLLANKLGAFYIPWLKNF
jgi:hypothetical protein